MMTESSDFDAWLLAQGIKLEPFSGYYTDVKQTLRAARNLDGFKQYLLDIKIAYNPVMVFKINTGLNSYRYEETTFKQDGMALIITDSGTSMDFDEVMAEIGMAATPEVENMEFLTEKRKAILLNALYAGFLVGGGALAAAFTAGGTINNTALLIAVFGGFLGGIVNYLQAHQQEFETGANGKKKPITKARIGI